jgi:hypothetical protein
MNPWKQFCRAIENKIVRRHFGDLVPLVETCAIFEFTAEQIEKAQAYEAPPDAEHPIPPFPFSQMCCVGPGGVIVLRDPVMNSDTGVLEFETIISQPDFFQTATCTVDSTTPTGFNVATHNVRGVLRGRYFDEATPYSKIEIDDVRRLREKKLRTTTRASLNLGRSSDTRQLTRFARGSSWVCKRSSGSTSPTTSPSRSARSSSRANARRRTGGPVESPSGPSSSSSPRTRSRRLGTAPTAVERTRARFRTFAEATTAPSTRPRLRAHAGSGSERPT